MPGRRWYHPCLDSETVPQNSKRSVQQEPVVLWRMKRPDGLQFHSVISPGPDGAVIVWFVNGRPLGFREFVNWTSAIRWSDQLQAQNWAAGWRALD